MTSTETKHKFKLRASKSTYMCTCELVQSGSMMSQTCTTKYEGQTIKNGIKGIKRIVVRHKK